MAQADTADPEESYNVFSFKKYVSQTDAQCLEVPLKLRNKLPPHLIAAFTSFMHNQTPIDACPLENPANTWDHSLHRKKLRNALAKAGYNEHDICTILDHGELARRADLFKAHCSASLDYDQSCLVYTENHHAISFDKTVKHSDPRINARLLQLGKFVTLAQTRKMEENEPLCASQFTMDCAVVPDDIQDKDERNALEIFVSAPKRLDEMLNLDLNGLSNRKLIQQIALALDLSAQHMSLEKETLEITNKCFPAPVDRAVFCIWTIFLATFNVVRVLMHIHKEKFSQNELAVSTLFKHACAVIAIAQHSDPSGTLGMLFLAEFEGIHPLRRCMADIFRPVLFAVIQDGVDRVTATATDASDVVPE